VSLVPTVDAVGPAPPAGEPEDPATHLLRERVRLLAEQSAGAAASTLVGALLIALVLAADVSPWRVWAWVGAYLGPAVWRTLYSRRVLQGTLPSNAKALRHYLGFALFNGLWTGALPIAFFASLSVESRVALTVVTLLSLSAGAATFASYRIGYLCVLVLSMPPLVFEWAAYGAQRSWIVAVTLVVFGALMVKMSKHLAEVFERSVEIRFEREKVVEQLRLEKQQTDLARQAAEDANRAKSRFLANASHDLRQPAHALGLFVGVLEDTAQTQQHRDIARNIATASRMLGELLDNLLDISRLDAGIVKVALQPVELRTLVERLRADAARIAGDRSISVSASADDLVLLLDPVLIERALRNLLDNALKFTAAGSVRIGAHASGEWLELRVEDSGCGIPLDQHRFVFEEFYQVGNPERDHRRGLGLGLSIVARLATLMGGRIEMVSHPGRGSTFTLCLPLRHAHPAPSTSGPAPGQRVDLRGRRVLVVDDEQIVRAGMRELLCSWGATVDEADGLAQARELAPRNGHAPWSLCLCDLRLRDGEDGIDTARALRHEHAGTAFILITGDTAPARIEQATASGLALLHKPVTPGQLAQAIRSVGTD
jgi:signal transduction histidine kinase/CheY-like chemotaxis protein